ncbi:hypothetical protein ACIBQ1_35975 [Nonomuraea sp. NPDC050153]|uniref:aromatic-ring hydroxylase C-terminal domain-containing protein n=1 Tax=Nonomuraea sp. NPDC050153 TaxID=3364359 RepID=UPI0037AA6749
MAGPWRGVLDVVEATVRDRDDLAAALVRPDGAVAWACPGPRGRLRVAVVWPVLRVLRARCAAGGRACGAVAAGRG